MLKEPRAFFRESRALRSQRAEDKAETEEKKEEPPTGRRAVRFLLGSLALLVVVFMLLVWVAYVPPSDGKTLGLDDVYAAAATNRLQTARLLDEDAVIVGRLCLAAPREAPTGPGQRPSRCYDLTDEFHASYPRSDVVTQQLIEAIAKSGTDLVVDQQTGVAVAKLMTTALLPLLMLANLFGLIFVTKSGDNSLGEVVGFGRIGRKRQRRQQPGTGVTFVDVAGADEAVVELQEVIDYLSDPARFQVYGAAPPKGVLLFGPPGCGKTLLARATAGESGVPFFSVSGTEFVESLVGVGAARVRDLFRQVREVAPAIMFIDEIDAVGRRRSGEGSSGGEREQTLNQLLVELDGFEVSSGIVLMGATNRPDILDPALMRPGRFDRHITLEAPDVQGRIAILELHAAGRPIAPEVDLAELARRTPGFTGADLANVVNEAALLAIRQGGSQIQPAHLSEAVLRVLHGPQRRGRLLSEKERRRLAFHEAGHALVAAAFERAGEVHRVSIVGRGRALAQTAAVDGDERQFLTATEMKARVAMAMSGLAAEVLAFGESSTTALDDVGRATDLAREMVGLYGMSEGVGRVRLLRRSEGYLDADGLSLDLVAGPTMAEFDAEVRRLTAAGEAQATAVLLENSGLLGEMVEVLQAQETLEGPDLAGFLTRVRPAKFEQMAPGLLSEAPRAPRPRRDGKLA